jgi:hypothetical protein
VKIFDFLKEIFYPDVPEDGTKRTLIPMAKELIQKKSTEFFEKSRQVTKTGNSQTIETEDETFEIRKP